MKKLNVVITAGGTSEYIDKIRKITNSGTGKLGATIANKIASRSDINKIYYICSPKAILPNLGAIKTLSDVSVEVIKVIDTMSLKVAVENVLTNNKIDYFIHSMAVSDYMVDYVSTFDNINQSFVEQQNIEKTLVAPKYKLNNSSKLSSSEDNLVIVLKQTPKIIGLIKSISPNTKLIGFKLLEDVSKDYLLEIAGRLMDKNDCDYVLANDLKDIKEGNHKALLLNKDKSYIEINGKEDIAIEISKVII